MVASTSFGSGKRAPALIWSLVVDLGDRLGVGGRYEAGAASVGQSLLGRRRPCRLVVSVRDQRLGRHMRVPVSVQHPRLSIGLAVSGIKRSYEASQPTTGEARKVQPREDENPDQANIVFQPAPKAVDAQAEPHLPYSWSVGGGF